jgi:hypothetical protein
VDQTLYPSAFSGAEDEIRTLADTFAERRGRLPLARFLRYIRAESR